MQCSLFLGAIDSPSDSDPHRSCADSLTHVSISPTEAGNSGVFPLCQVAPIVSIAENELSAAEHGDLQAHNEVTRITPVLVQGPTHHIAAQRKTTTSVVPAASFAYEP